MLRGEDMAKWIGETPHQKRIKQAVKKEVEKEVEKIRERVISDVARDIVWNYHLLWMLALRDEFRFSTSRMKRVLDRVSENADALEKKYMTFDDIRQTMIDEIGIDVGEVK